MRSLSTAVILGLCLLAVLACSNSKTAPVGRWEGTYEANDAVLAARLEITPKGDIFLSAPDMINPGNLPSDQRQALHQRIADELAEDWGEAQPRHFDFDGRQFRKPGGVAPQMEWNPDTRQMTVIVYPGMHPTIRIPMREVKDFSDNPWPN